MNAALHLEAATGGYGRLCVFRELTLSCPDSRSIGILGPNGAGKTTLLNTIAGLLPLQSGSIKLHGNDVTAKPAFWRARNGIALVPEGRQILGSVTVRDNLRLSHTVDRDVAKKDKQIADVFGLFPRLQERESQLAGSLSGGEQQMLAIGRALMMQPKALLLDEPTQGLAPIVIQELVVALRVIKSRFTMLLVEQNRSFLENLADDILTMRAGALESGSL